METVSDSNRAVSKGKGSQWQNREAENSKQIDHIPVGPIMRMFFGMT